MEMYPVHPDKIQEKALKAFLIALQVPYEIKKDSSLPTHVVDGIRKGQQDIATSKSLSFEEFKDKIKTI